jgi:hypothetical protein
VSLRGWSLVEPFRNMGGDISFSKLVIVAVAVAHFAGHPFSSLMATILISASLGKSTWESFLQRGQWNESESTVNETKDITERRVTVLGEPGIESAV